MPRIAREGRAFQMKSFHYRPAANRIMNRLAALSVALCLIAGIAVAQELPGDSLGLIPEAPKNTPKPKPKPDPSQPKKKSSTEQESDDLQARIRYREARTKALQDPRLQQEWDRAEASKTEHEKREGLKSYYKLLFDRMVKIDSSVKPRVEVLRKSLVWRLDPGLRQRANLVRPLDEREREETETQIR